MRIGFFIQNSKRGGLDTFLINLINNFDNKNHELCIIYNKSHDGIIDYKKKIKKEVKYIYYDYLLSQDIDKTYLGNLPFFIKKIIRYFLLINSLTFKVLYFKKFLQKISLDRLLIINGGYQGGEACNSALFAWKSYNPKYPAWYSFHNYAEKNKNFVHLIENFLRNIIDKKISECVKGFISVSKSCLKSLNLRNKLTNNTKIVIYNGLSVNKKIYFSKKKSKTNIISMLAVYEKRKGFDYILKAFNIIQNRLANTKLYMYGDGTKLEKTYIKNLIKRKNLERKVFLKKFENNKEKIYKNSDLIAIPSQYNESFGYVAIEAFYYNKPVIACKTGGLKEVITNNYDGLLVSKKNHKFFAKRILDILTNKKLKEKITKNGKVTLNKKFTAKLMAKKYLNLITDE